MIFFLIAKHSTKLQAISLQYVTDDENTVDGFRQNQLKLSHECPNLSMNSYICLEYINYSEGNKLI